MPKIEEGEHGLQKGNRGTRKKMGRSGVAVSHELMPFRFLAQGCSRTKSSLHHRHHLWSAVVLADRPENFLLGVYPSRAAQGDREGVGGGNWLGEGSFATLFARGPSLTHPPKGQERRAAFLLRPLVVLSPPGPPDERAISVRRDEERKGRLDFHPCTWPQPFPLALIRRRASSILYA